VVSGEPDVLVERGTAPVALKPHLFLKKGDRGCVVKPELDQPSTILISLLSPVPTMTP
jgi:hypothetical protein